MTEEVARPGLEALDGRDAVAVSILIALPVALYAPVAGQWWTGDDTQLLKHALSHGLRGVFTVPSEWRELSWLYFTPLIDISVSLTPCSSVLNREAGTSVTCSSSGWPPRCCTSCFGVGPHVSPRRRPPSCSLLSAFDRTMRLSAALAYRDSVLT